jgi:arginine/lysine/ornithine decarboxylase
VGKWGDGSCGPGGQEQAPLAEALTWHAARPRARFHVPGHKGGNPAVWPSLTDLAGPAYLRADVTELPELDDLHWPSPGGPVGRAQALAAEAFGAGEAWFLTGGATAGVLAMVLAAVGPGQTLLVTLPFHRSIAAAAILAGCDIRVVPPRLAEPAGVPIPAAPESIARAVAETRPAALLITSPTYHGVVSDLTAIGVLCRRVGVPLLVDAAHGAHLGFSPALPAAVAGSGAAAWVVSLHKTAGALTPGALLLVGETATLRPPGAAMRTARAAGVDRSRLASSLRFVQSSSPSFPVLASLDLARRQLVLKGREDWTRAAGLAAATLERVSRLAGGCLGPLNLPGGLDRDPTRLVFAVAHDAPPGLTGLGLAEAVREAGVDLEMAGWGEVVAVVTPADTPESLERLGAALVGALAHSSGETTGGRERELGLSLEKEGWEAAGVQVLPPGEAFRQPRRLVPVAQAAGRVAADVICPYPPGVPLALPGQRISNPVSSYLALLGSSGRRTHGLSGRRTRFGSTSFVEVIAE